MPVLILKDIRLFACIMTKNISYHSVLYCFTGILTDINLLAAYNTLEGCCPHCTSKETETHWLFTCSVAELSPNPNLTTKPSPQGLYRSLGSEWCASFQTKSKNFLISKQNPGLWILPSSQRSKLYPSISCFISLFPTIPSPTVTGPHHRTVQLLLSPVFKEFYPETIKALGITVIAWNSDFNSPVNCFPWKSGSLWPQ